HRIVVTGAPGRDDVGAVAAAARGHAPGVPILAARHVPTECWEAGAMRYLGPEALRGLKLFAFAGIGSPDGFRQTLEETGALEAGFARFADHHWYSREEVAALEQRALAASAVGLVTTEKDWARLRRLPPRRVPLHVATVLGGQGLADTLVTYPRAWSGRLAAADVVRRLAPDTAVLLPNSVESALAAWYWGAGRRIGFDAGVRGKVLTDVVALPEPRRHQIDEYLMLAERSGASADDAEPTLTPPPADGAARAEARALLAEAGAHGGRRTVGVHLGAAYGPAKTWPAER